MKKRQAKKNYKNLTDEQMLKFWSSELTSQKVRVLSGVRAVVTVEDVDHENKVIKIRVEPNVRSKK